MRNSHRINPASYDSAMLLRTALSISESPTSLSSPNSPNSSGSSSLQIPYVLPYGSGARLPGASGGTSNSGCNWSG